MQDDTDTKTLDGTVFALTNAIVGLGPGPLARLRRMDVSGPGEGDFWKLAVRCKLSRPARWLHPVRLMALLTPRGSPDPTKRLHDRKTPFGQALATEDLLFPERTQAYPEIRLMRFLALPKDRRGEALERMVRWLATKGHSGVDCTDICALLFVRAQWPAQRLAETYYCKLDRTTPVDENEENTL